MTRSCPGITEVLGATLRCWSTQPYGCFPVFPVWRQRWLDYPNVLLNPKQWIPLHILTLLIPFLQKPDWFWHEIFLNPSTWVLSNRVQWQSGRGTPQFFPCTSCRLAHGNQRPMESLYSFPVTLLKHLIWDLVPLLKAQCSLGGRL